ncbi:hypothetical protein KY084_11125 [Stakelama sp. CBK3Z-3]|uniref:Lipoprotein n=1 Tax=Stakelama flava TaxID=2860338 RepID=A0ABS6XMI4_9SPHN|nr:hypothetical protein [Stakelama flava]MBW4331417.1 hypothetical protein [Stakelama flava]
MSLAVAIAVGLPGCSPDARTADNSANIAAPDPGPTPSPDGPPVVKPVIASDPSETVPPEPGRASRWYASGDGAVFGTGQGAASLSIACDRADDALVFHRTSDDSQVPPVANLNLSLVEGASLVRAFSGRTDEPGYTGQMPLRDPWLDKLLATSGTLETDLDGRSPLSVPVAPALKQVIRECRSGK